MIELITEEIDLKNNTNNNTNSKINCKTNNKTKNNVNQIRKDNYQDIQETNQIQQKNYVDKLYDQYYQFKKNFTNLVKRNRKTLKVILILLIVLTILETYQHFTLSGIQIGNQIGNQQVGGEETALNRKRQRKQLRKEQKMNKEEGMSVETMMQYGMNDKTMIMNILFAKYVMEPIGKLAMYVLNILILMALIVIVPAFPLLIIMMVTFHFAGKFFYKLKSRM